MKGRKGEEGSREEVNKEVIGNKQKVIVLYVNNHLLKINTQFYIYMVYKRQIW